jgi:hypothetical protein
MVRKQRFSMLEFTIYSYNLVVLNGHAKAYLVNYILDKLQESMGNIFILCNLSWIM